MESQFSDQELHDVALGYKPTTKKVQNLCGELLSTRAALSALQEATRKVLSSAVKVIYLDDSSDYGPALWNIIGLTGGEEAINLIEDDEQAAYEKYCNLPTPPEAGTK